MNLGEILAAAARTHPEQTAVIGGETRRTVTFEELDRRADAVAAGLVDELGVRRHDRVALLMANGPELLESLFAVWKAGAVVVPVDPRSAPEEVVSPVNNSEARLLVAGAEFGAALLSLAEKFAVQAIVVAGGGATELDGAVRLDSVAGDGGDRRRERPAPAGDDAAWLALTSGGAVPRARVALTHAEVLAAAEAWPVELPPVEAGDVGLVAAPLHQGAALMALAFVRRAAAQVGLGPSGAVASSLGSAVAGHRVTHAWLSASQIGAVLHEPGLRQADLSSLKVVAYGDGPLDAAADVNEATARVGAALVRLIVSAGLPVSPAEIEEVLLHHAGISQAAVTGVPDDRWGEAVTAMVVPAPGARLSEAEVLAFAGSQLPAWKKPKSVEFVTALPEASAT